MQMQFLSGDGSGSEMAIRPPSGAVPRVKDFGAADTSVLCTLHAHDCVQSKEPVAQEHNVAHERSIPGSTSEKAPSNKALKLTKGAEVRAPRHSASHQRCSVPRSTFFTNVPSQLNAVLGRQ